MRACSAGSDERPKQCIPQLCFCSLPVVCGLRCRAGPVPRPATQAHARVRTRTHAHAGTVDVSAHFADPGLFAWWAVDPLAVSSHHAPFAKCALSAAVLSNDQSCVGPVQRMQVCVRHMQARHVRVHVRVRRCSVRACGCSWGCSVEGVHLVRAAGGGRHNVRMQGTRCRPWPPQSFLLRPPQHSSPLHTGCVGARAGARARDAGVARVRAPVRAVRHAGAGLPGVLCAGGARAGAWAWARACTSAPGAPHAQQHGCDWAAVASTCGAR